MAFLVQKGMRGAVVTVIGPESKKGKLSVAGRITY